ncbi:kinesin-like protein KIF20B [Aulostomus maculatus]
MMESCQSNKADRGDVEVDDLNTQSPEFSILPDLQQSSIEEREHLQVYLRVRPFTSAETENGESQECVAIELPDTVLLKPPSLPLSARLSVEKSLPQTGQRFQFSQVYGPDASQRELFEGTVKDLVKDVLEGGNSLVFTYGVTNAGKTFTFLGPDADAGILPRSLQIIFNSIDEQVFTGTSIKPQRCREFTKLTREQQAEEAAFKRNLLRQYREGEKSNASLLNSTCKTPLEGSPMLRRTVVAEGRDSLEVEAGTKFSVWVSFCEIYNESIHDLLEVVPNGALRRTALRLSQDIKGNAFVKDLRWVQVNSAEEAYKVMKLGKRNQSFSSTRLNQLSSRSHSIFSIRILKIEDVGTPRVKTISELCLCDLAGSERCAKTQNKGERLKEAGNINTSMLILGKCINALRHNQQAKLLQHVPFRESKLTHYLQGFFCGRGKACMIVNINQCASMYDETLNVLKFSAVAQKVVVLSSRPLPIMPQRSGSDVSLTSNAERKMLCSGRRSSLIGWESSLEDVQENEDDDEDKSLMQDTVTQVVTKESSDENDNKILISKRTHQRQVALLRQLEVQLKKEQAESLLMEERVREEISREFSELFSEMQNDFNDRLVREREILEERAERRLEIFKNLIDKMAAIVPSQDAQAMDKSLDSCSSELAGLHKSDEAATKCPGSGRAATQGDTCSDVNEIRRKMLELTDYYQEQLVHKATVEANKVEEERRRLLAQLQEKSSLLARLEKQVADLQMAAELSSRESSHEQLQEVLATFEKEKRAKEDALAALEQQTELNKRMLASLEEERKTRKESVNAVRDLKQSKEEMMACLEEERKGRGEAVSALEAERRAKEDAITALREEQQSKEEALAALGEEKSNKEEAQSALAREREEICRLIDGSKKKQQEDETLREEVRELAAKLKASECQVTSETRRAEQASAQLQAAQLQVNEYSKEILEKNSKLHKVTQEIQGLKQELETTAASASAIDQLREEVSELSNNLTKEKEKNESKQIQIQELEKEIIQAKEELANRKLISDQQVEELNEKLNHQEAALNQQVEELRRKLQQQEQLSQQHLKTDHELEEHPSREVQELRKKLEEQTQASEKQVEEFNEKLREQEVVSQKQLLELNHKLTEQKATSDQLLEDLKQKLSKQEETVKLLQAKLEEASSSSSVTEDLKRLNSDLLAEVASLRAKVSNMEEERQCPSNTETQLDSSEMEKTLNEKNKQMEEKMSELEKASAERESELQKNLSEMEAQVTSLKKNLREAQDRREEEESQAVQEARRREVEHRRELLAVAHEAIAQKDAELEKRTEEISSLKENAKQDSEKVKSLSLDLQRKDEDISDLREKLADYKKQIQQVQKEISAMKEDETTLRQKLSDVDKVKKQLQSDLANRDRTIQQLKLEQSSGTKSNEMPELYQKACKDLEAKERIIEDMRLALMEQEETQEQMEQALEEKSNLTQELSSEVENLKGLLLQQNRLNSANHQIDIPSDELKLAKKEAVQAQESLKLSTEKHQAERRRWMDEKLSLIGQIKEAEDKRNQEMKKFADDRERYTRQQSQLESQLAEKEQTMDKWRKERDTLVSALDLQLQKLLSSQAEKDQLINQLRQNVPQSPQEGGEVGGERLAALQAALSQREVEVSQLKEELKTATAKQVDATTQIENNKSPAVLGEKPQSESITRRSGGRRNTRASVSSQGSSGYPSVLDSSEISTEDGRTSRFPRPELEISFSPLQPNRMALRRQGDESAVTVKITRSGRKRKSGEMEKSHLFRRSKRRTTVKEEVEAENRRNTKSKGMPKLTPHQEEISSPAGRQDSQSSPRSRKEGTLQKIGDFLQSSPTLLGTKAKKMMSLVSGKCDADLASPSSSSSSLSLRAKKNKRKLYRPEISSPMDMPSHPIISREPEEKESDHQIIKRRLRSRMAK